MSTVHLIPAAIEVPPKGQSGVYVIICKPTGQFYVGGSIDIGTRWASHKRLLRNSKSPCTSLQEAWNAYGEGEFEFRIIELCHRDLVCDHEQTHIRSLKPLDPWTGLNRRWHIVRRALLPLPTPFDPTPPPNSTPIHLAPYYRICDGGIIWSFWSRSGKPDGPWHILKPNNGGPNSHLQACLIINGTKTYHGVHRLVLETLVGPCPEGMEGLHRDGNPRNNFVANLRWGTHKENAADRATHGRNYQGEAHYASKIKESDVPVIIGLAAGGMSQREIAKRYGVKQGTAYRVINRITWKHVKV